MNTVEIAVTRLPHNADLPLPMYETAQSAGMDVPAAVDLPVSLAPGKRAMIPTGLALALPSGYEAQIRPRSGLAAKNGITVLNTPGTVDADYRGEVKVILINLGDEEFIIQRGMRIAQILIAPVTQGQFAEVDTLPDTARGGGGFGSTGI
ncbi:MAG: Deoxyuridine 5'-triphosphate nucleotidohydrolase [Alphaproteobacteria bacterium MarineAlpha11_Bin1]|nr:MAG: Deoxyuridine 5'-triphosphate nucleotidohydrolase [Alphaproteobacteria bacterium MarineAlpha11_Bin1]|tara:strand:- start:8864 stop:9313 length:450 start_codon:yes stop_codon:yes gene_type:complete